MKKITGLLLAIIFVFVFSGCSTVNDLISDFDAVGDMEISSLDETPIHVEMPTKIQTPSETEISGNNDRFNSGKPRKVIFIE